jgi:hypothetical protein
MYFKRKSRWPLQPVGDNRSDGYSNGQWKVPLALVKACSTKGLTRLDANPLEDDSQRAKTGKRGLQHVEPDERGPPQKVRTNRVGQQNRGENKDTSNQKNDAIDRHFILS